MTSFKKRVELKIEYLFREQEEYWLGKKIIKDNPHAAPDFMIIGTVKSGTTSLFQYLAQHPALIPPQKKELLYFSVQQRQGLKWYLRKFPLKKQKKNKLTFEGSPSYIYYEDGLKRIKHLLPEIKLIAILRDPVKRSFSQWNFNQEGSPFLLERPDAKDSRSFQQDIKEEIHSTTLSPPFFQYIYRSLYAKHLKALYKLFPSDQILILDFEDLKKNPQKILETVTNFLGINNIYNTFENSKKKVEGLLQTKDNHNNRKLKTYNSNTYKEKLDSETEKWLRDYFSQYDAKIVRLTGKKFSWMDDFNFANDNIKDLYA
jgi:hypothetical protein